MFKCCMTVPKNFISKAGIQGKTTIKECFYHCLPVAVETMVNTACCWPEMTLQHKWKTIHLNLEMIH
jgi:hypothetical protein